MSTLFAVLLLASPPVTQHRWALVELEAAHTRYWQALAPGSVFELPGGSQRTAAIRARVAEADRREGTGEGCPAGMVRVKGPMPSSPEVIARQNQSCEDPGWNPKFLCNVFDRAKLTPPPGATKPVNTCIDRFEFPNIPGEYPGTLLSYDDGVRTCAAQGKHLCTDDEWTFACEGPEALPYPYGYSRYLEPTAHFPERIITGDGCNIDVIRHGIHFDPKKMLRDKWSLDAVTEIDKLWAGVPSGSRVACRSPFGVYDITGNIEEWVNRDVAGQRPSVLKGGYWSPVESRCQPSNAAHGAGHAYYQTGFRCCLTPAG